MGKDKAVAVFGDEGSIGKRTTPPNPVHYARMMLKLLFGSQSIMFIAITIMSFAVLNGDAMQYFTNGAIINFNDFLTAIIPSFAYVASLLIATTILVGPIHYYLEFNMTEMIIILIIVFLFTSFFLGRMFKHPLWAFASGFIVMTSFVAIISIGISFIDTFATQMTGFSIKGLIFGLIEGVFGEQIPNLFFYTIFENGAVLGVFAAFWGSIFMPRERSGMTGVAVTCNDGDLCKI
jgi:hypothetical protein